MSSNENRKITEIPAIPLAVSNKKNKRYKVASILIEK